VAVRLTATTSAILMDNAALAFAGINDHGFVHGGDAWASDMQRAHKQQQARHAEASSWGKATPIRCALLESASAHSGYEHAPKGCIKHRFSLRLKGKLDTIVMRRDDTS